MLNESSRASYTTRKFKKYLKETWIDGTEDTKPKILRWIIKFYFWEISALLIVSLIESIVSIYVVQLLAEQAIGLFNESSDLPLPLKSGYSVGILLCIAQMFAAFCRSWVQNSSKRLWNSFKNILSSEILEKSFKLSPDCASLFPAGKVFNLFSAAQSLSCLLLRTMLYPVLLFDLLFSFVLIVTKLGLATSSASLSLAFISGAAFILSGPSLRRIHTRMLRSEDLRVCKMREAILGKR